MERKIFPFLLAMLFSAVFCNPNECPREEAIAPSCICKNLGDGPMLSCSNLVNPEELIPPIKSTDNFNMFSLSIFDSTLLYIPSKIFLNTKYQKIMFWKSQILSLTDTDLAFEGLEDSLEELRAIDAHYVAQWDWSTLKNHHRLSLIDVHHIAMHTLDQKLPAWKNLRTLGISQAEISFVHPRAFRGLENLGLLVLKDNDITEMARSMLPKLATKLYRIDLSGNQLTSLPDDMFTDMPNLEELDLSYNKLATLNEETFQWPFEHLQSLMLLGNQFRCDCRIRWLVKSRKPFYFEGKCTLPDNMKDHPLKHVANNALWC